MDRNDETGFTLLEMSAVIMIFGIVLTIALVGTTRLVRSNRLAGTTNMLVTDLRLARSLAVTQRRNYQVRFATGTYSVVRVSPASTVLTRTCPQGVTCTASDTATFFAWGLTDPVTITLSNSDRSNTLQLAANGNVTRP